MRAFVILEEYNCLIENIEVFLDEDRAAERHRELMEAAGFIWCPETESWHDREGHPADGTEGVCYSVREASLNPLPRRKRQSR